MKNEIEVIDGVKGEWRTVTKPSDVTVGQRVRYEGVSLAFGYSMPEWIADEKGTRVKDYNGYHWNVNLFNSSWKHIQAFFPLPVRSKRKVAKVYVTTIEGSNIHYFALYINNVYCGKCYSKRSHAIRGAKRFCKAIGYECEIVKEGK